MNQSVRSVNQSVSQSVGKTISQLVSPSVRPSVRQSVSQSVSQLISLTHLVSFGSLFLWGTLNISSWYLFDDWKRKCTKSKAFLLKKQHTLWVRTHFILESVWRVRETRLEVCMNYNDTCMLQILACQWSTRLSSLDPKIEIKILFTGCHRFLL